MAIFLAVYLLSSIVIKRTPKRDFRLRRNYLRTVWPILGLKVEKTGKPIEEAAMYIANHRTFIDPFVMAPFVDVFFVAKAEVGKMPIFSIGFDVTGVILVDRKSKDSRSATRVKMVEKIKEGYNVLVYPEGTTGAYETTKDFKMGTFSEAANNNFRVVPIVIEYQKERDRWESGSTGRQYFRQIGKWRTRAKLHFGPVFQNTDRRELLSEVQEYVDDQLAVMQKDFSEPFIPKPIDS